MDFYSWFLHIGVCLPGPDGCQLENCYLWSFAGKMRGAASGGAVPSALRQRGAKSPLDSLNSCPQRLTFPLLRVGSADGTLTLGLLLLILPPPGEAEPRHGTNTSSPGSALTQLRREACC